MENIIWILCLPVNVSMNHFNDKYLNYLYLSNRKLDYNTDRGPRRGGWTRRYKCNRVILFQRMIKQSGSLPIKVTRIYSL